MPATYTHAVYGQMVLDQLDEETRELIEKHRDCYDIGLSGPDILFFYHPLQNNPIRSSGYAMHQKAARSFFESARSKIKESSDPEAALVYILGFINHFVLDSQCHPLINRVTARPPISHSELESELDARYMRKQNKDPIRTKVTEHLKPSAHNEQVIAPFFDVRAKDIKTALNSMIRVLNLFVAPNKLKRNFLFAVMKAIGIYEGMHGLIFNAEENPDCIAVCNELEKKVAAAVPVSVQLIAEYRRLLHSDEALNARYDLNYE